MKKWLWYINGSVTLLAVVVLVAGLGTLQGGEPQAGENQGKALATDPGKKDGDADSEAYQRADSPLVAMARQYSLRLNPPPPPKPPEPQPKPDPPRPKPPDLEPKPQPPEPKPQPPEPAPKPPEPPPEPKEPEKVKPPGPTFQVQATMIIGPVEGYAWPRLPGRKEPNMVSVGDELDHYQIIRIADGYVELDREGFSYKLEVPKPPPPGEEKEKKENGTVKKPKMPPNVRAPVVTGREPPHRPARPPRKR